MNNTILLSTQCFHNGNSSQFKHEYNISSCKYVWTDSNTIYHVINLKHPTSLYDLNTNITAVEYHYNVDQYVDEIWEQINNVPITSVYNLDRLSNIEMVKKLASQMLMSISSNTNFNLYYKLFNAKRNCVNFLQNIASFTINSDFEPIYIQLNRECIINLKISATQNTMKKKLIHQLEYATEIIKVLFFTTSKKKNQKNPFVCSKQCKLTQLMPRFINTDHEGPFVEKLHEGFCNYTKLSLFECMGHIFPDAREYIDAALHHVYNL
ncbi:hypothetical protein PvNV_083 [Penaeus vannamei nudivirus]|nr:hypothetical protein PvSNPV_083 [Penaeus vannamei nucleopolyhedrovirus]